MGKRRSSRSKSKTSKSKKKSRSTKPKNKSAKQVKGSQRTEPNSAFDFDDQEIESHLKTGRFQGLLESYFGEEQYQELRQLAGRSRAAHRQSGQRVLILPGILGSKLGTEGFIFNDTIWLDPGEVVVGNLSILALDSGYDIKSLGVMQHAYLPAKLRLSLAGFDTDYHHYDWRLSIEKLGRELEKRIIEETGGTAGGGSISLVAHSMGGLVARQALQRLNDKGLLDRVNRLVMLGTPNFGSFAPALVVQTVYETVQYVAALDLVHTAEELSELLFRHFPGLIEMLPATEKFSSVDLFKKETWPANLPRPETDTLRKAKRIQGKLFPGDNRCVMVCGINQNTVTDLTLNGTEFEYHESSAGDGTVPLAFAELPKAKTNYAVEQTHGKLPSDRRVLKAVIDILETGETDRLPLLDSARSASASVSKRSMKRKQVKPFKGREGEDVLRHEIRGMLDRFVAAPDKKQSTGSSEIQVFAASSEPINIGRQRQHRISLNLGFGSITDVDSRAVVLGAFEDVVPTGASKAIDDMLGGTVTEFISRNLFSARVGEVFILPSSRRRFGPVFVVFAGMGRFDQFDLDVLKLIAENVARTLIRSHVDDFALVPMGGASGISITDSIASLVEGLFAGILEADVKDRLSKITMVEFDRTKYGQMRTEVLRLATTDLFDDVEVTVQEVKMPEPSDFKSERRSSVIVSGPEPIYLYVQQSGSVALDPGKPYRPKDKCELRVSLLGSTESATVVSETVRFDKQPFVKHLEQLDDGNFGFADLETFGNVLTEMVLPVEVLAVLKEFHDKPLVLIHDAEVARIPWETMRVNDKYVAVEQGISRQYAAENLSIGKWLDKRALENQLNVLLIVNPTGDLAGTEEEANKIEEYLKSNSSIEYTKLLRGEATWNRVRTELSSGKYDVVHYAGHGKYEPNNSGESGILCHGYKYLTGAQLANLSRLPALAFFNACEVGRVRGRAGEEISDQVQTVNEAVNQNMGLAEAFLRGGIANYVGTYWPVSDSAAADFAKTFYDQLLSGSTIGSAIQTGRRLLLERPHHDLADYMHYGNPHFVLKIKD